MWRATFRGDVGDVASAREARCARGFRAKKLSRRRDIIVERACVVRSRKKDREATVEEDVAYRAEEPLTA